MPTINYAEKWQQPLIETIIDNSYISPFVVSDVQWLDAKTFHFTTMSVSGYKPHSLLGGWNRGDFVEKDHPYTVTHDRDIEFFVDKRNVDESNQTASAQNISEQFLRTQATPEMDSYFFSKVATQAITAERFSSSALSSWNKENVLAKLHVIIGQLRRYRNKGLILYVRPEIMGFLALAPEFDRNINVEAIVANGKSIQTRITALDGVPLVEVIDDDRMYTAFDFTEGCAPAIGSYKINVLGATPLTTKFVPKISSIYLFAPGQHTQGDGYLYQNRAFWDTFIFPNGKNGEVDSIFVDRDTTAVAEG